MKVKALVLVVVLLGLVLAGCGADPRDAADARRTDAITAQDVADRELARQLKAEQEAARSKRWNKVADALTAGAVFGGKIAMGLVTLAGGVAVSITLIGLGQAASKAANFRADWVPLDKTTRQYPQIRQWVSEDGRKLLNFGKGVYLMGNLNDGSVTAFDEGKPADKQKVAGMISAWNVGLVSDASKSAADSSSEGVSMIAPAASQIITANSKYLEVGDGAK